MIQVSIEELQYELHEDVRVEHNPTFYLWLSQDVSNTVVRIPLDSKRKGTLQSLSLEFDSSTADDATSIPLVERIRHAYLNLDVFCTLITKMGERALNQAGSLRIPVSDLLIPTEENEKIYALCIPSWGDPNAHGQNHDAEIINEKGWIKLKSNHSVTFDRQRLLPLTRAELEFRNKLSLAKESVFRHYMSSTVAFCKKLGCRWPAIKDINAYVYMMRSDIIPASAYCGARLGGTTAAYFENAARIVLRRRGKFFESFDWLNDPSGPEELIRTLTLAANYCAYVPDAVLLPSAIDRRRYLKKALESFDYARMRCGGDCEDLALEIILEAAELAALGLQAKNAGSLGLSGMIQLRNQYVFSMALGGVSSAEISGEFGKQKSMGAHI